MLINKICGEMTDHMSPAMPPPFNDVDFLFLKKRQPNFLDRLCYYLLLLLYWLRICQNQKPLIIDIFRFTTKIIEK